LGFRAEKRRRFDRQAHDDADRGGLSKTSGPSLPPSESWFYKWRDRKPTARQQRRTELADAIRAVFDVSGGTYGSHGWRWSCGWPAGRSA
jgi:hypothetical protein